MEILLGLDGTDHDPTKPLLRAQDLGVTRGDGVFETVLVVDGQPRELDAHLARLQRSAAMLDMIEPDLAQWQRCVEQVCQRWDSGAEMALKLVYTRGVEGSGEPTAFAYATEIGEKVLRQRENGVSAVSLERGADDALARRAPWLLLGAKSLSYAVNMAALREAARRDADEVVFVTEDGSVLEGPTSTVALLDGRTLRTPPDQLSVLPGTTKAAVFRAAEAKGWQTSVEPIGVDELHRGDGVVLMSSVRKISPVRMLDGKPLESDTAAIRELQQAYDEQYR